MFVLLPASSVHDFQFLSELYAADAPQAIFLPEYPSSKSRETNFQNVSRYPIHDPFPPPQRQLLKVLGPHHLMSGWGRHLQVTSEIEPPVILLEHWVRHLGEKARPTWIPFDNAGSFVTLFPHEKLLSCEHVIDPELLHSLHSKELIADIACPQPRVLTAMTLPCVVKLTHGYSNTGNFFLRSHEDMTTARNYIDTHWPEARLVITEIVNDLAGDYGVQFYLTRSGDIVWIGILEQLFDANSRWAGGTFSSQTQSKLAAPLREVISPVARHLHRKGYFGVVGVDVLQDKHDRFFVVDINPRITGASPFLVVSRLLVKNDLWAGLYVASVEYRGTLHSLIEHAENEGDGMIVILSAIERPQDNATVCHVTVNSDSLDACKSVFKNTFPTVTVWDAS